MSSLLFRLFDPLYIQNTKKTDACQLLLKFLPLLKIDSFIFVLDLVLFLGRLLGYWCKSKSSRQSQSVRLG